MIAWTSAVAGILLAGAAQAAPAAARSTVDACRLLTLEEVQSVQKVPVKEAKGSNTTVKSDRIAQCVFATSDFAHSVSVTVVNGAAGAEATRAYWKRTFETVRPKADREAGRVPASIRRQAASEGKMRRVTGIGTDAYWTGDGKAGSLYVLSDEGVLRISVGGVSDPDERIKRTTELARAALQRLRG